MSKVAVLLLLVITIAVLCYLVFISLKLLRKAENERKADISHKRSQAEQTTQLKAQEKDKFES